MVGIVVVAVRVILGQQLGPSRELGRRASARALCRGGERRLPAAVLAAGNHHIGRRKVLGGGREPLEPACDGRSDAGCGNLLLGRAARGVVVESGLADRLPTRIGVGAAQLRRRGAYLREGGGSEAGLLGLGVVRIGVVARRAGGPEGDHGRVVAHAARLDVAVEFIFGARLQTVELQHHVRLVPLVARGGHIALRASGGPAGKAGSLHLPHAGAVVTAVEQGSVVARVRNEDRLEGRVESGLRALLVAARHCGPRQHGHKQGKKSLHRKCLTVNGFRYSLCIVLLSCRLSPCRSARPTSRRLTPAGGGHSRHSRLFQHPRHFPAAFQASPFGFRLPRRLRTPACKAFRGLSAHAPRSSPHGYSRRRESIQMVTGPSLTSATCMSAPNTPVATRRPVSASTAATKRS